MFGSLGMPELIFILLLALLIFGPKRLPQIGRTLGRGMREFRQATSELKRTVETEITNADIEAPRPAAAAAAAPVAAASSPEAKAPAAEIEDEPAADSNAVTDSSEE